MRHAQCAMLSNPGNSMLDFIFTIDYEIYGNGQGSLKELVLDPMARLMEIFQKHNKRLVVFAEAAELEMIERFETDPALESVNKQLKQLFKDGFEIGLHLHPQWYNAKYVNGEWELDYSEYNLCILSKERIIQIIDQSINYFQRILSDTGYIPVSFRAGNWLFQPTKLIADVLSIKGIKIDSSVFKGGRQHQHQLDYRRSLKNGYFWEFNNEVNVPVPNGAMFEIPIHTQMVPFWKMLTGKRVGIQHKGASSSIKKTKRDLSRYLDFLRFRYPLKLDFCKMTLDEMISMMEKIFKNHDHNPTSYWPVVSIGHTKDLMDFETVDKFLSYLEEKGIAVTTFKEVYVKILAGKLKG
jgi:hypothetical protein